MEFMQELLRMALEGVVTELHKVKEDAVIFDLHSKPCN